jgi:23S rRNA pseudouridine955/2504/2580 synthase
LESKNGTKNVAWGNPSRGTAGKEAPDKRTDRKRRGAKLLTPEMIVYEDEDIILINKPAGILSQKAKPEDVSLN